MSINVGVEDVHAAGSGRIKPGNAIHRRGFSGAIGTKQAKTFALVNLK
jgi:hypothetical protein